MREKTIQQFTNNLAERYTRFFDVYRNQFIGDIPLAFIAQYHRRDERYMLSKKFKIYGVENQQLIFTTTTNKEINTVFLQHFQQQILANISDYTKKHEEHMSTVVLGLIVTNQQIDPIVQKYVKKFRKIKFLTFGWHGWIELYIAILQPNQGMLLTHSKGKPFLAEIHTSLKEVEWK